VPQPRRVYLHLGLQKTGTSYLQGVLAHNADTLARQGLDLVPASRRDAFELMLQVRERYNPERDPASVAQALERFTTELARARGSRALVSQESLAATRPRQLPRLLEACRDREVHVLLTVRDLARQLPSSWQQELKAGKTDGYLDYLHRLRAAQQEGLTRHPWIQLDPVTVLSRWADWLPPERIHVVTVPPAGSPASLLLDRFCRVLEVDPSMSVLQERARNTSLGRVQAEVLRRVNAELSEDLRRRQTYGDIGKRFFASRVLADQPGDRILVPAEMRDWCDTVATEQIHALSVAGYDIVGDLEDLHAGDGAFATGDTGPSDSDVAGSAVVALGRILTMRGEDHVARRSRRPRRRSGLRRRLGRLTTLSRTAGRANQEGQP
jgi:hypothetical protein